jgi:hypothetical protein
LCTSLNDTQDIVVYIGFTFSCQRFFLSGVKSHQLNLSISLEPALEAGFVFSPTLIIIEEVFYVQERTWDHSCRFVLLFRNATGSGSQFQVMRLVIGSQSLLQGDVTKLASGASFEVCEGENHVFDFAP